MFYSQSMRYCADTQVAMAASPAHIDMRWIFDDPAVRKIRHELREGASERRRAFVAKLAIGVGAATATFIAGVEILNLGAIVLRLGDLVMFAPLASALTMP